MLNTINNDFRHAIAATVCKIFPIFFYRANQIVTLTKCVSIFTKVNLTPVFFSMQHHKKNAMQNVFRYDDEFCKKITQNNPIHFMNGNVSNNCFLKRFCAECASAFNNLPFTFTMNFPSFVRSSVHTMNTVFTQTASLFEPIFLLYTRLSKYNGLAS